MLFRSADEFDVAPLAQLRGLRCGTLGRLVEPFFSTLTTQYRMASAISAVPRRLFYGGKALLDGKRTESVGGSVDLLQVDSEEMPCGESNHAEARFIMEMVANLASAAGGDRGGDTVMIITPYSEQFELLERARDAARKEGRLGTMDVQCLTIDRCQGREASYVFVSLVRPRASAFMDMPKRWNVALTRARKGLALVGDIKAYEFEANRAYSYARGQDRPKMSLLARLIWEYKRNNVEAGQVAA